MLYCCEGNYCLEIMAAVPSELATWSYVACSLAVSTSYKALS